METQEGFLKFQKRVLWLSYLLNMLLLPALAGLVVDLRGLYLLLIPAIGGFILSLIKLYQYRRLSTERYAGMLDDVNMFRDHYLWLLRTFIITIVFSMAALGTVYYGYGYILAIGIIIWWFYRIIRGIGSLFAFHGVPVWR